MQYRNTSYAEGVFDTFWFEKNLQGDVVAIYNNAGVKLASYIYDAWGNFTVTYTNGGATTAAQYNPFTYRSYYYDDDLGLYYLNSRYYDSNTGRFINADGQLNDSLLGYNLFAYCENNPVMYTDPEGTFIFSTAIIIGIIVGAIIGGTIGGVYAYNEASEAGATGWEFVGYTALGVLGGSAVGAFAGGFLGYAYPTVSAFMSTSFPLITVPHFLDGVIGFTTIYVTGSQVVAGSAIIVGGLLIEDVFAYSSNNRPGNNQAQNKQFKDAVRSAGYNPNDPNIRDALREIHNYIRANKLNLGWKDLLKLISEWLG